MEMTHRDLNEEGKKRHQPIRQASEYDFRIIIMEPYYFPLPLSMSPLGSLSACKQYRQTDKSIDAAGNDR